MLVRYSTEDYAPADRLAAMHDLYAAVERVEIELTGDGPARSSGTIRHLPGVTIVEASYTPCISRRRRKHLADGNDDLVLCMVASGALTATGDDGESDLYGAGEANLGRSDQPSEHRIGVPITTIDISVPRRVLAPRLRDIGRAGRIRLGGEATRLLFWYAQAINRADGELSGEIAALCAAHIVDLAAIAAGATRDAGHAGERGGLRAARLARLKADLSVSFADPRLSADVVAARQGISPQYLRALLAREGTSFSALLLTYRLAHARRLLENPTLAARNISAIAYDSGFGDLSYFNRSFRQRYGARPGDVRGAALAVCPWARAAVPAAGQ